MTKKTLESTLLRHWRDKYMTASMKGQANVLTPQEFKRLLKYVSTNTYGKRDTLLILFSYGLGLRAVEMAAITLRDVVDEQGKKIETENQKRTKSKKPRTVYK